MSYIVPGKKPRYCQECCFRDMATGECNKLDYRYTGESQYEICPLTSLPPHDELIERGKLIEAFGRLSDKDKDEIMQMIISADTVIDADWSGE